MTPIRGSEPLIPTDETVGRTGPASTGAFTAGGVTGVIELPRRAPAVPVSQPLDEAAARRRMMRWFAGGAGGILACGIAVLLALVLTGNNPLHSTSSPLRDSRPLLAKLCPPPSGAAPAPTAIPPTPAGPRTVDSKSGISYQAFGEPWNAWNQNWPTAGELNVAYRTGQYFITERQVGGNYLATILSSSVPAATNDALTLDLKCTGHQVAADVRSAYYPQPNTMDVIRDQQTTLGGLPAWVSEFRLHFNRRGLVAKDELVAVALIDVGRPNAAILYVSIPGTHRQFDYVIDQVLASVRPA